MRDYELMIVTMPEFPHDDAKAREDLVKKLLSGQNFEKLEVTDLGKKQLAYEIKKKTEGCYLLARFSSEAIVVGAIEKQVKLSTQVLRYLLTKRDE